MMMDQLCWTRVPSIMVIFKHKFRVDAGDQLLKEHLETCKQNAMYTSKEIQNQIIIICGDVIRNKLLDNIRKAKFFAVIADEATDSSNSEQLSISFRFVGNGVPQEKFLGFKECLSGVTGEAIADTILSQLSDWQLEPQKLRGQAYDGAGAMAGKAKGAATRITLKCPKALYTHCAAHKLNLCVMKCCSIREVANMQIADKISRFFSNTPKRLLALETWINDIFVGEKRKKLKEMCRTRWVERHEAFQVFSDLFMPVFCCLEATSRSSPSEWNRESKTDSFLLAMSQFPFIIALQATQNILAYTKGLSVKLQGRYTDIARAYREIETVKSAIQTARKNINSCHNIVYTRAKAIAGSVGIEESVPRLASRQQHRSNVAAENC